MKYTEKFPQTSRTYLLPQEIRLEEDIIYSHRFFPCIICKTITAYRLAKFDYLPVPCCSEECREKTILYEEETANQDSGPTDGESDQWGDKSGSPQGPEERGQPSGVEAEGGS